MNSRLLRLISLLLAITWAGTIYYLSSKQGFNTPSLFSGQDKVAHLVIFGILGFLVMGAMNPGNGAYRAQQVWLVIGLVSLYGVLDELHQHFVPGRHVDALDVLADTLGGILGALLMVYVLKFLAGRVPSSPSEHG